MHLFCWYICVSAQRRYCWCLRKLCLNLFSPSYLSGASSPPPNDIKKEQSSSKTTDQEIEEEILSIQSTLRTHHRHAAYGAALETALKLLKLTSTHFGNLHPATASAYNNVGLMNKLLGNYREAKDAYHESLSIYSEVCGRDHASYAAALSNLGMLERGRVLESEAMNGEKEQDDGTNSSSIANEEGVELLQSEDNNNAPGSNSKLSAMERMQLNESAIEYFDEAYRIRLTELGPHHPHTITSRSQLGSAMAAAVIAERKGRIGGEVESELRKLKQRKNVTDVTALEVHVPEAIARATAKVRSSSKLTRRRWEAAEEHLRGALMTSVENPRGESVGPLMFIPIGSAASSSVFGRSEDDQRQQEGGLMLSKKNRRLEKKHKRNAPHNRNIGVGSVKPKGKKLAVQGAASKVCLKLVYRYISLTSWTATKHMVVLISR